VAYHDACHLRHGQGVHTQPRAMLRTIPGLTVVDLPEPGVCCGSAGIYNLVEPETGADLGRRKADHVTSVAPDALVTANAGCLVQLRRHLPPGLPLLHPVELVDASIRGLPFPPA
jgi:glycolate oxidase iron-sulfur subunit